MARTNAVAHFEIYADDLDKLTGFYTTLFDWSVEPASIPGMDYRLVKTVDAEHETGPSSPGGINGGLTTRPSPEARLWMNYVNVDSVDKTLDRARKLGAVIKREKSDVPGMGSFAVLEDPQGNTFAIWEAAAA